MKNRKKYWKSPEGLLNNPAFVKEHEKEFTEELPIDEFLGNGALIDTSASRRDFLKFLGFSVGTAALAACEGPVRKAIPYLNKPEEITPGVANWYASTYIDGRDYCPVLVKTREGRPIHLEGNKMSVVTNGAINARVQGSVLSLYDSVRLKGPVSGGKPSSWELIDSELNSKFNKIRANGGKVRVLSSSLASPTTKKAIDKFLSSFASAEKGKVENSDSKHIVYDAVSHYGIRKANEKSFGKAVVPSYHLDKAKTIVSVGADFLANWIAPIELSRQYGVARRVDGGLMAKHIQFEAGLSLTGSNADVRVPVKPSLYGVVLTNVYNEIAKLLGRPLIPSLNVPGELATKIMDSAQHLLQNKDRAVLVCGSNNPTHQIIANGINELIGSYDSTIDLDNPILTLQSNDAAVAGLLKEMEAGEVAALIFYHVNPAYSLPESEKFKSALAKVPISISFSKNLDETASLVNYVCPDNHYLESWDDANPRNGQYSLCQPTIHPLFDTRQAQESLLKWAGAEADYLTYLKMHWEESLFPKQAVHTSFISFWNQSLHDGVASITPEKAAADEQVAGADASSIPNNADVTEAAQMIKHAQSEGEGKKENGGGQWELVLYEKTGIGDGSHANNPWLQELPDPVSKVCWDNYLTMNPTQMKELGFSTKLGQVEEADLVDLSVNGVHVKAPVYPQYGQVYGTVGLALGYGRTAAGKTGNGLGVNGYPLCKFSDDFIDYNAEGISISGSIGKYQIATTQTHHTMMGREPVRETSLEEYNIDPKSNNPDIKIAAIDHKKKSPEDLNLWKSFDMPGHHWGMAIDLNACIGCGACVVGCNSENNVPVVGKDEVRRSREMHWIRIDRYYSSEGKEKDYDALEIPSDADNLEVLFQPLMCQHCNHAPCETVCPVAATTHSNDGLNQMVYNRCVGTKFCLVNCPYKVRRFNWFSYQRDTAFEKVNPAQDEYGRMVLNPDVVVRGRGVMEKCSMCIQRIQDGKLTAKKEGRKINDGEIQTACASACPTKAITFGDKNNPDSQVAISVNDPRKYYLLEELDTQPTVHYLTKIRNK